jgi:ADP-ribosylglycohydrolase
MTTGKDLLAGDDERLARARCSLEGLSVGDALGQHVMVYLLKEGSLPGQQLPPSPWYFTDDTYMALSIISLLCQNGKINQDLLVADFALRYKQDAYRGYGPGMHVLLQRINNGQPWREASQRQFAGQGSFGNGAAMRVAPLGAYFADSIETVIEQAQASAEVTHAHPEGVAGAIAVAVAAAWAWRLRERAVRPTRSEFIDLLLPSVPESEVRAKMLQARNLGARVSVLSAAAKLGNGSQVSAQDTVPFVLWCAGHYLGSYEQAMRQTLRAGGDLDTTCAMVGGIVVLSGGTENIPLQWRNAREPLPDWPFQKSPA